MLDIFLCDVQKLCHLLRGRVSKKMIWDDSGECGVWDPSKLDYVIYKQPLICIKYHSYPKPADICCYVQNFECDAENLEKMHFRKNHDVQTDRRTAVGVETVLTISYWTDDYNHYDVVAVIWLYYAELKWKKKLLFLGFGFALRWFWCSCSYCHTRGVIFGDHIQDLRLAALWQ